MSASNNIIKPVGRTTLTEEVVKQLTDLIMKGVWKPGDVIPSEKEMTTLFGVGRSTVREAVQSLSVIGVLEKQLGGKTIVKEPTSELLSGAFHWGLILNKGNLGDLTEVRIHIEVECAALAAERIDEEDLTKLVYTFNQMETYKDDEVQFMKFDNLFHRQIAETSKNKIYVNLVSTIQELVSLWYPSVYKVSNTKDNTINEHKIILNAIQSRDPHNARKQMLQHIENAAERLNYVFENRESI